MRRSDCQHKPHVEQTFRSADLLGAKDRVGRDLIRVLDAKSSSASPMARCENRMAKRSQ